VENHYLKSPFVPDLPDQSGRNIVITGGNRGIGFEAVKKFLDAGAHVIVGKR
jgi:NAD(P)-dependent dehydrogenase (short-subunit alcohol dehydrogenase family)